MEQKVLLDCRKLFFATFIICLLAGTVQVQTVCSTGSREQAILSVSGTIGDNGWYTTDVEAFLYSTGGGDTDSIVAEYALYNQGWNVFEEPFTIFQEGQTVIYYRVRNEATDSVGETKFSMIDIDKTPPTGALTIDGGNKDAYGKTVTLTLSISDEPSGPTTSPPSGYIWGVPSGPSDMRFSNDGIAWSSWEINAEEKIWLLESGGGTKTVYAQVRDNAGLVSETFSDTINLLISKDNSPPITTITVNGKQISQDTYTSAVILSLNSVDDISGVNRTEYSFDNQTWYKYTNSLPLNSEGLNVIYYRSVDFAGNVEAVASHTINIEYREETEQTTSYLIVIFAFSLTFGVGGLIYFRKKRLVRTKMDMIARPSDCDSAIFEA